MIGLSVDPGAPHVGIAIWKPCDGGWYCAWGQETTPDDYVDRLWKSLNQIFTLSWVAMESFHLFPDKAKQQTGSSFPMVELIGTTRQLCRIFHVDFRTYTPDERNATFEKAKARGYGYLPDAPGHVKSAVSVGLCRVGWTAANHRSGTGVGIEIATGTLGG